MVGAPRFHPINIELTILRNQIEDLMNVKGIAEKNFLKLKARLTAAAPIPSSAPRG